MSTPEGVLSCLQKRLRAEQVVLQEQHRRMYEYMESQHVQVLAEMESMLSHFAKEPSDSTRLVSPSAEEDILSPPPQSIPSSLAISLHPAATTEKAFEQSESGRIVQEGSVHQFFESAISSTGEGVAQSLSSPQGYKSKQMMRLAGDGVSDKKTKPLFERFVQSPLFELICGIVIIINTIVLAFEIEYHGQDSGHAVEYGRYRRSSEHWPDAEAVFRVLDISFVSIFTFELLLRVCAEKCRFWHSGWIWFDFAIVAISWFGVSPAEVLPEDSVDPTLMRLARLARMIRAIKMIRSIKFFDSLYVLLKSIQASVGALFWSFLLLIFVQVVVGMILNQLLQGYILDDSQPIPERTQVFKYYGTFSRTMITMFEISLVNWAPSCRILMENVSELYGLFYIVYVCCFIFAVIRVIQAVFIAETNRVVAADDQIAIRRKELEKSVFVEKLTIMFEELDKSGDGKLTLDELQHLITDKLLRTLMSTLGVTVHDVESLFKLLADGDGEIDIDDFTRGLSRCKGLAQGLDVVILDKLIKVLDEKVDYLLEAFGYDKVLTSGKHHLPSRKSQEAHASSVPVEVAT